MQPSGETYLSFLASHFSLQSNGETTRIALGITIMTVKTQKTVNPLQLLLWLCFCRARTHNGFMMCNNVQVFFSWQDECYNYIKVLVPRNDETLFACGTNAFNPTCRNYKVGSRTPVCRHLASITDKRSYYSCYEVLCPCIFCQLDAVVWFANGNDKV